MPKTQYYMSSMRDEDAELFAVKCPETDEVVFQVRLERIGSLEYGIDGRDEFFVMTNLTDDLAPEVAIDLMSQRFFSQCTRPGGYFCDCVLGTQQQYRKSQVILTVQHRYDV